MNRPTSVTVMSVLGCIFGTIGLICCSCNLVATGAEMVAPTTTGMSDPTLDAIQNNPLFAYSTIFSNLISIVLSGLLLAASISSFSMAKWARKGMIIYAWCSILNSLFSITLNTVFLIPAKMPELRQAGNGQFSDSAIIVIIIIALIIAFALMTAYPIAVLIVYSLKNVREAFEMEGGFKPGFVAAPPTSGPYANPFQQQQGGWGPPGGYQPGPGGQPSPPPPQYGQQPYQPPQQGQGSGFTPPVPPSFDDDDDDRPQPPPPPMPGPPPGQ